MISGSSRAHVIDRSGELRSARHDAGAEACAHNSVSSDLESTTGWLQLLTLALIMMLPFVLVAWLFS